MRGYYFITDAELSRAGNHSDIKSAVAAGVHVVQYRCKKGTSREMCLEAESLKKLCDSTLFLINDRIDIALVVDADGVHLGQDDMPLPLARRLLGEKKIIGLTVHDLEEAREAEDAGADYLGVSPIFPTRTKVDAGLPAGIGLIREIKAVVNLPLIAIGGITLANARDVVQAGADGLCSISATVTQDNVQNEIEKFQHLFT